VPAMHAWQTHGSNSAWKMVDRGETRVWEQSNP
jgi:hypothetical protein